MAHNSDYSVSEDTIFISGLPEDVTETQLSEYFGQIGIIKFDKKNNCPKIWIYKDKASGKGKGEATITYDDPPTATSAINWFNGKEFSGSVLSIQLAQRKSAPQFNRGGRGRPGGGVGFRDGGGTRSEPYSRYDPRGGAGGDRDKGRPGGQGRPGDWLCPSCSNNNFAYRQKCNRCQTEKPGGGGGGGGGSVGGGGYRDSGSRDSGRDSGRDGGRDSGRDVGRGSARDGSRDTRPYNGGGGGGRYDDDGVMRHRHQHRRR